MRRDDEEPRRIAVGRSEALVYRHAAPARVVLLPGARYSTDAPLLWFAKEIALAHGAGALAVRDELPADADPFAWASDLAQLALAVDPAGHQVVVGKSLASAAAGLVADRALNAVWLTPLLDQKLVTEGLKRASVATMIVGGTADDTWKPRALSWNPVVEVLGLLGLDHSLQAPGDPAGSVEALATVVALMERFLVGALADR